MDIHRAEAARYGGLSSRRPCWRVFFSFLVNRFHLPECRRTKVLLTHLCNKRAVSLLLNSPFPGFSGTRMLGVVTQEHKRGTPSCLQTYFIVKELTWRYTTTSGWCIHSVKGKNIPPHSYHIQTGAASRERERNEETHSISVSMVTLLNQLTLIQLT